MTKAPVVRTTCVLDCPDTCSLEVSVENGVIGTIRGSQDHPTTNGFICSKVSQFARRVYHDQRLLYPLRRRGAKGEGDFVRISWDEAIAEITARFRSIIRRHGGEAILPYDYGGSNGFITAEFIDSIYFARLGASRLAKTVCAAPTGEVAKGMYGKMAGVAFEDYPAARLILIWGANPKVSNIHLVPFLKEAKKKGAFIAVVDPVRNFSPALVDLHMPVYPGADLPVALAMIRLWKEAGSLDQAFIGKHAEGLGPLLERARAWTAERAASEARVSPESIRKLATVYAETSPAVLRCGWGVERNRNGGQAVAAILAMPALLGKFGVRGGGYTLSNSGAGRADMSRIWDESSWRTRVLNMTRLGELLTNGLKPPLKAFFVFNCNPVASVPDQKRIIRGLSREDLFTVVFEQVLTDTARYADILLPATTFLEHHDVRRAYGSYVAGGIRPVIEPRGEARSNPDVFAALGRAMGFQDEPFSWSPEEARRRILEATELNGRAANRVVLAAGRAHLYDFPGPSPVQFGTVFPKTADGKIHLTPSALGREPYRYVSPRSRVPLLALLSPASSRSINSTLAEWSYPELAITLSPRDAADRDIEDGHRVRVFNEWGEVVCRARVSDRLREGVALMPKGAWRKASLNGYTATALTPAHVNEVGGGACFNDARVEVERASSEQVRDEGS